MVSTVTSIEDDVIDKRDVARILRKSVSWVEKASLTGDVPSFKVGAARRYRRSSIERWVREQETKEARS